jgi:hypothetical protein
MGFHNNSTEAGKHPYCRKGFYWQMFGHLYETASPKFKRRMDRQKAMDEKGLKMINSHYPNARKP